MLDLPDATDVLRDLATSVEDQSALEALAQRLGCHPLALSLAGSYLGRQLLEPMSVDEYLERLNRDPSLLDEGAQPGRRDLRQLISSTWQVSLDTLSEQGGPESTTLLRLLSCYAGEPLPVGILAPSRLDETLLPSADPPLRGDQANGALEGLLAHSLVSLLDAPADPRRTAVRSLQTHPLLLETVAAHTPVDQSSCVLASAAQLLDQLLATQAAEIIDVQTLRLFAPHAVALLRRTVEEGVDAVETALAIVRTLRDQAYARGDYSSAHALATATTNATTQPSSQGALSDRHEQGRALAGLGRFDEAVEVHQATLQAREALLGADHADTLDSSHALGLAYYGLGKWAEDERCMRRALEGRERCLGVSHPDTVDSRGRLSEAVGQQNRWAEAESLAHPNLTLSEESLGREHPRTLLSRIALAWVLAGTGQWSEAAAHTRATLAGSERVLGPDHPRTLAARHRLAAVLPHLGQWEQAERAARTVLSARQKSLGNEHPHTLSIQILLARTLRCMGHYAEAEELLARTLASCTRVLGADHPDTLACRAEQQALAGADVSEANHRNEQRDDNT